MHGFRYQKHDAPPQLKSWGLTAGARAIRNFQFLSAVENEKHSRGLDAGNSLKFGNFLTRDLKDLLILDGSQKSMISDDRADNRRFSVLGDFHGLKAVVSRIPDMRSSSHKELFGLDEERMKG